MDYWFQKQNILLVQCDFEMLHLQADTGGILHTDPNFNLTVNDAINFTSEVIKMLLMMMMMMMMIYYGGDDDDDDIARLFQSHQSLSSKWKFMQNRVLTQPH